MLGSAGRDPAAWGALSAILYFLMWAPFLISKIPHSMASEAFTDSGSFIAPGDMKATPVTGVVLQGEHRAIGYFVRNGVRGFVEVTAKP